MAKKTITSIELANHFEVSKRTILRDIEILSGAGIPIYTTQGRGGGISLLDRYVLNKTVITETEQKQILVALQGMSATQYIDTDGILGRLQSLFAAPEKDWIEVDFSRWGSSTDKVKFETLKDAILNEQAVLFNYYGIHGETNDRKIIPLKLVFKTMSWYLQAFCTVKNEYRIFKISRMRDIKILSEAFDSKAYQVPDFQAMEHFSQEQLNLKLFFEPRMAFRVYDEFSEDCIYKNNDGSFIVKISFPDDAWVYDYLLSFGTAMDILEPESVRMEIVRKAENIKNKYL